jgi:hypothetical protein
VTERARRHRPAPLDARLGPSPAIAGWLSSRGAVVEPDGEGIRARIAAGDVESSAWRVERAALLVRYLDRRTHDRRMSCELTRIRASMMLGDARVMGLRIADLREAVRRHSD